MNNNTMTMRTFMYACVCMCVQVLYTVDLDGKGSVVKRKIPVVEILYDSRFVQLVSE